MPIEEPLDLSGLDGNPLVARDRFGQLLEAGAGLADKLHQNQDRNFRWKLNCRQAFGALALNRSNVGIDGKVYVSMSDLVALEPALSAQLNENRMAPASELCAKLLRAHACRTAGGQVHQSIGQAACTRKADVAVEPQALVAETRDRAKRVPASIVGETAEVSNLGKKTANGWNRIAQLGSQGLDPPAWLFEEKGGEAFPWL